MAQSKIEFRLGDLHFIGEGEKAWVTRQLDKIIIKVPSLLRASGNNIVDISERLPKSKKSRNASTARKETKIPKVASVKNAVGSNDLSSFIRTKKVGSNQRVKFLATAAWIAKQGKSFVTRDISKALKEAQLPKLANPSVNLSQNVKQGYLKKSGKGFVLSSKGKQLLNSN